MEKKLINPEALYDGTAFGMSQAVIEMASGLVFVSGQVDWNHHFETTESSVEGQMKKALDNLHIALKASDSSIERILQLRIYIRGELGEYMNDIAPILSEFLGTSRPAITGIGVASLASPQTLVEIEAIARST